MSLIRTGVAALVALAVGAGGAAGQVTGRGTEFWGAWPRSHLSLETSAELVVMADADVDVVVEGAFTRPAALVGPGMPLVIPLPESLRLAAERTAAPVGFRVRSLDPARPVSVLLRVPVQAEASDDIAVLLPVQELGTSYLVSSFPASLPNEPSFYAVIATQDDTRVNAAVPCAGTVDSVTLDAGEVYQVFCNWRSVPNDVTGALVTSDKPIAVLGGNSDAYVPVDYLSGDFLVEALAPTDRWGSEFYVTPLPKLATGAWDVIRVMASGAGVARFEDSTGSANLAFAAPGQFTERRLTAPLRISSTDTTLAVTLFATGVELSGIGDPFMIQVPPVEAYSAAVRAYVPPDYTQGSYLDVTTAVGATSTVRVDGLAVAGWTTLPGGTHAAARVDLGSLAGEHVVSASQPLATLVYGFNDTYQPNPGLGAVPGSFGYAAPHSNPSCELHPVAAAPEFACDGSPVTLSAAGSSAAGCAGMMFRWRRDGVLVPGCTLFSANDECDVTFDGTATYTLEARCADDPTCVASDSVGVFETTATTASLLPNPAVTCPGVPLTLTVSAGFVRYDWTSVPADPGVTPATLGVGQLAVTPDVATLYTVVATDPQGCVSTASVTVNILADPLPPPVGESLRVVKDLPADTRLTWQDVFAPVRDYEVVGVRCPSRFACGGRVPDSVTLDASALLAGPIAPRVEVVRDAGALTNGFGLVFYNVRATSPCSGRPGPTCNGFPMQLLPCP